MTQSNGAVFSIQISSKNFHPSEKSEDYINKKLRRLEKFYDSIQFMDVRVEKNSKGYYDVNVKVGLPQKRVAVIKESGSSLFPLVDKIYDRGERMLSKYNHHHEDYHKGGDFQVT